ncbi:MAG: hypothetical protein Q8N84_03725 [bacterium]|nr:hypothetical protein [bacterium]
MGKFFKAYAYFRNLHLCFLGAALALVLSQIEPFRLWLMGLHSYGYLGVFLAGMLFVSTFTVALGATVLFYLAASLKPVEIALIAGFGAVLADYVIFRFVKNRLRDELLEIYKEVDRKNRLKKMFHSRFFSWSLPVMGAIIIASPLPDELGVGLLGFSEVKTSRFLLLSYLLNSTGIFLVTSAAAISHTF